MINLKSMNFYTLCLDASDRHFYKLDRFKFKYVFSMNIISFRFFKHLNIIYSSPHYLGNCSF